MQPIHLPDRRTVPRTACLAALLCALLLPLADLAHPARVQGAPANTITVNSLDDVFDNSKCSLRAAILSANLNGAVNACAAGAPGVDTINVSLPVFCRAIGVQCAVPLQAALPDITEDLTINGSGVGVDGADSFSVFGVRNSIVTFNHLLIRNGRADYGGGGITTTNSTLTLNRVTLSANHAYGGAGLYFNSGAAYVHQSQFLNNISDGYGGAIGMTGGYVVVDNSTFQGNGSGSGGAIAGLNECTNGCMSVEDRSCFSYQVAAGSTMSE